MKSPRYLQRSAHRRPAVKRLRVEDRMRDLWWASCCAYSASFVRMGSCGHSTTRIKTEIKFERWNIEEITEDTGEILDPLNPSYVHYFIQRMSVENSSARDYILYRESTRLSKSLQWKSERLLKTTCLWKIQATSQKVLFCIKISPGWRLEDFITQLPKCYDVDLLSWVYLMFIFIHI